MGSVLLYVFLFLALLVLVVREVRLHRRQMQQPPTHLYGVVDALQQRNPETPVADFQAQYRH